MKDIMTFGTPKSSRLGIPSLNLSIPKKMIDFRTWSAKFWQLVSLVYTYVHVLESQVMILFTYTDEINYPKKCSRLGIPSLE